MAFASIGSLISRFSCTVDKFCCCSVRFGVIFVSILFLVNASLAFAGEAALYLGVLNALSAGLPPGTKLEDPKLHGGLIIIGLWCLTGTILGFVAAFRRNLRAATGFLVIAFIDLLLAVLIGVISFMAGAPLNALIAQVPALLLNVYFVVVIRSWRLILMSEQGLTDTAGLGATAGSSSSGGDKWASQVPPVAEEGAAAPSALAGNDELDVDEGDIDIDLESGIGAGARSTGGQGQGKGTTPGSGAGAAPAAGKGSAGAGRIAKSSQRMD